MKKIHLLYKSITNPNKFSSTLLLNFLAMAILPIVIVSIISYIICYNAILSNSVTTSHEITDYAANEINRVQAIATDIAESVEYSSEIQLAMRYDHTSEETHLITPFHINTSLNLLQRSVSNEITGIYCYNKNDILYQSNTTSSIDEIDATKEDWYQTIIQSSDPVWFKPHDTSFITGQNHNSLITYGLAYYDYITHEPNGAILVDINADTVFNNLSNSNALTSNTYYVLDTEHTILFSTDGTATTMDDKYFERMQNSQYYYSITLSNGWQVVGIISENNVARDAMTLLAGLLILVLIITIILAITISIRRAKQISEPLHTLIENMDAIHGRADNSALLIPSSTDEIVALYRSFNIMIEKSNQYIEQIKHEQAELRHANFKALQAQINPHFLYNTMDTIAWNIRLDEKEKAINCIMALTKFFRASLRKGNDIINVTQEMEQVSLYLQIQMFRYDDVLDYHISFDNALAHCILPKLILQPIVENAIYHGIKNKGDYGHIEIYTEVFDGYYHIIVTDDGLGMNPQRLEEINNLLENNMPLPSETSSGYGISNVNERIKIYFGDAYGITYESELNKFTKVTVKLPIMNNSSAIN